MTRHADPTNLFQSVLCPVDFSGHSRVALQFASAIAARSGGQLTAIFARDPLLTAAAAAAEYDLTQLRKKTERELRQFVARATSRAALPSSRIATEVLEGQAGGEILKAARRLEADLVVMGTQGLSGAGRAFFGSTTERVLRQATVPILAVPPAPRRRAGSSWPGRHVLAPLMLGPEASSDATVAAAVARWFDAQLVLAHVVQPTQVPRWMGPRLRGHDRARLERARARLERIASALELEPTPACHVVVGRPAQQIAALATARELGLIIVTLRAIKGWLGGLAQGTTTYRVLGSANLPVLALPARWKDARQAGASART